MWLRGAVTMLLPWPSRHERQAAITAARREKERSQAQAGQAEDVARQIRRMTDRNHFAELIVEQIMQNQRRGGQAG